MWFRTSVMKFLEKNLHLYGKSVTWCHAWRIFEDLKTHWYMGLPQCGIDGMSVPPKKLTPDVPSLNGSKYVINNFCEEIFEKFFGQFTP